MFNRDKPNVLKEGIQIPSWWQGPTKKRGVTSFLNNTISYGKDESSLPGSPEKPILRHSTTVSKKDGIDLLKSQEAKINNEGAYTDEPKGPKTLTELTSARRRAELNDIRSKIMD